MKKFQLFKYFILLIVFFVIVRGQDSVKIMPLGDSITELNWQGGYRSYLYKLLSDSGFVFDFVGRHTKNHDDNSVGFDFPQPYWEHEGYTGRAIFPTWLDHIDTALTANLPDIVLLMLGTNDVANGTRSSIQIRNHLSAFLDSIWKYGPNIKVVLSNLPRGIPGRTLFNQKKLDSTIAVNALLPAMVLEKKSAGRYIIMIDNFNGLTDSTDFDGDGVHPSVNGYKKMRYVWYPAVVSALLSVSKAELDVEPTNTTSGSVITPAVTVRIEDILGNPVTGDNSTEVTMSIKSNPGNGILTGGGPVTVTNGIATFNNLSIDKAGIGYTLEATSPTVLFNSVSDSFDISHGAAAQLTFSTVPSSVISGDSIKPVVSVRIEDTNENLVTIDNSSSISLTLGSNPGGGVLSGGDSVIVSNGLATFGSLKIDKPGSGYTLTAVSNPALSPDTSAPFNVTVGAATKLSFEVNPTNSKSGDTLEPAVTIKIEDANQNLIDSDNSTSVTIILESNPGGGVLSGGGPVTAQNGIATFSSITIDKPGTGYILKATSTPELITAVSSSFIISPSTGIGESESRLLPTEFALGQNYPNPFNPSTRIRFDVPKESLVTLKVYDLLGRLVSTLFEGTRSAGKYHIDFDAASYPSGVYVYSMRAETFTSSRTMMLLK